MRRWTPLLLLPLVGCDALNLSGLDDLNIAPNDGLPPKIEGMYQLHQLETASGEIESLDVVLGAYAQCDWGRQTWEFQGDRVVVGHDVLCPGFDDGERFACSVSVAVPAEWDKELGKWTIPHGATATSHTSGLDDAALQVPTECTVKVSAGTYPVARIRNQRWRWEMGQPDGTVLRLRIADSDRPDFVRAIRAVEAAELAANPPPTEPETPDEGAPEGGE